MTALRLPRALSNRLANISTRRQPRHFTTTARILSSWSPGPAPPRLPKEEQDLFEQLQKQSTGAFSSAKPAPDQPEHDAVSAADELLATASRRQTPQINQSPHSAPSADAGPAGVNVNAKVRTGDGEELHPNIRRGAKPEFEGEVNPKTGEVGGPKNEPLRWGVASDWSYNGRVTDF